MNKKDLYMFKNMLEKRREQILQNIEYNKKELANRNQSDLNDKADFATNSSENFTKQILTKQQNDELIEVQEALKKIANNKYGICQMCDDTIQIDRLKVKPFAKFCIDCREIYEKMPN